jgi:hypothetical protein
MAVYFSILFLIADIACDFCSFNRFYHSRDSWGVLNTRLNSFKESLESST